MGWFSKKPPPGPKELPRRKDTAVQTALLGPVIAAMLSDGVEHKSETVQLATFCRISPIFDRFPEAQVTELIEAVRDDVKKRGVEPVVKDAAMKLSVGLRETAFTFAARMVVADGSINAYELAALDLIRRHLDIEEARANQIRDVMLIMLRPANA